MLEVNKKITNLTFTFQSLFNKQTNGMMGYMDGGSLPFDINDFASASPKLNDLQSLMNDSYTPVPLPVPPVPSISTSSANNSMSSSSNYMGYDPMYSTSYEQYNQSMMYNNQNGPSQQASMFPYNQNQPTPNTFTSSSPAASYMPSNTSSFPSSAMQRASSFDNSGAEISDEYNPDTWELDMSWNTTQDSSFNHSLDGPQSPPNYDRKSVNTNVIEYIEPNLNENHITVSASDVDHRQLIVPMNGPSAIGAKDRSRLIDVDHRNLISLTDSPKSSDKDTTTTSAKDTDFRQMLMGSSMSANESKLVPPPSPPVMLLGSGMDTTDSGKSLSAMKHKSERGNCQCVSQSKRETKIKSKFLFFNRRQSIASEKWSRQHRKHRYGDVGRRFRSGTRISWYVHEMVNVSTCFQSVNRNKLFIGPSSDANNASSGSMDSSQAPMNMPPPNYNSNNSSLGTNNEFLHQMLMHQQPPHMNTNTRPPPRPLLEIPTAFNSPRPLMQHHNNQGTSDMNHGHHPYMNNPRGPTPLFNSTPPTPMNNFRGGPIMRNNSPYYRNQKGFRNNNFRGGNMRGNW